MQLRDRTQTDRTQTDRTQKCGEVDHRAAVEVRMGWEGYLRSVEQISLTLVVA